MTRHHLVVFALAASLTATLFAQPAPGSRQAAVRQHVRALEGAAQGSAEDTLARLEREHLSPAFLARTPEAARRELVAALRQAASDAGGALIDQREGQFVLTLRGQRQHQILFTVETTPPYRIDSLRVTSGERPQAALELTADNLVETFTRLEREGWSGVVHVRLGGKVVLERAFGMANADLKVPMALDTIFCTGSRPIEYTVAALYLLEQQGKLTLEDPLVKFFPEAPQEKRAITLRQLANGQAGLPDFFHTDADWDADLAWVDRESAERRLLALPLLFAPGSRREHSHAAFGLLAAVVERVSGQTYAAFLRQHFFTPAAMTRTGFYGESKGFTVRDFAVGGGPSFVGLPNIPPNWGPTSWLVQGSGGMFSTLPDQLRFYQFVRSGTVLGEKYTRRFKSPFITLDGSDRGFELFQAHEPSGNEAILMVNRPGGQPEFRAVTEGLERLIMGPGEGGDAE